MDLQERVAVLEQAAQFDVCAAVGQPMPLETGRVTERVPGLSDYIAHVVGKGGRRVPLLKILLTSACEKNCYYCPFRAGRDFRRQTLSPDELALAFDQMQRAGLVEGLFLSSSIAGMTRTMDRMLATVELLREKYKFQGYVHLKILPEAELAQIERAVQLADRVSVNLEAPDEAHLAKLAPRKTFEIGLLKPLRLAAEIIAQGGGRETGIGPTSQTTQFVVGPAGESDQELLETSQQLYDELHLARAYYSAFRPIPDTPLENNPPTPPLREHRLYQADFLLRRYGFRAEELPYDASGNLSMEHDPKTAWALAHPELFPVEVNRADRRQLLRVPGVGPKSAARILQARRLGTIRSLGDLRRLGVLTNRAAPFVLLAGHRPPVQLPLWG
ncbi:MAG TPA: radical SAM protein [Anaerolineae bacterium]|nr:radical SAM protein [Anaerolineae bacterium]